MEEKMEPLSSKPKTEEAVKNESKVKDKGKDKEKDKEKSKGKGKEKGKEKEAVPPKSIPHSKKHVRKPKFTVSHPENFVSLPLSDESMPPTQFLPDQAALQFNPPSIGSSGSEEIQDEALYAHLQQQMQDAIKLSSSVLEATPVAAETANGVFVQGGVVDESDIGDAIKCALSRAEALLHEDVHTVHSDLLRDAPSQRKTDISRIQQLHEEQKVLQQQKHLLRSGHNAFIAETTKPIVLHDVGSKAAFTMSSVSKSIIEMAQQHLDTQRMLQEQLDGALRLLQEPASVKSKKKTSSKRSSWSSGDGGDMALTLPVPVPVAPDPPGRADSPATRGDDDINDNDNDADDDDQDSLLFSDGQLDSSDWNSSPVKSSSARKMIIRSSELTQKPRVRESTEEPGVSKKIKSGVSSLASGNSAEPRVVGNKKVQPSMKQSVSVQPKAPPRQPDSSNRKPPPRHQNTKMRVVNDPPREVEDVIFDEAGDISKNESVVAADKWLAAEKTRVEKETRREQQAQLQALRQQREQQHHHQQQQQVLQQQKLQSSPSAVVKVGSHPSPTNTNKVSPGRLGHSDSSYSTVDEDFSTRNKRSVDLLQQMRADEIVQMKTEKIGEELKSQLLAQPLPKMAAGVSEGEVHILAQLRKQYLHTYDQKSGYFGVDRHSIRESQSEFYAAQRQLKEREAERERARIREEYEQALQMKQSMKHAVVDEVTKAIRLRQRSDKELQRYNSKKAASKKKRGERSKADVATSTRVKSESAGHKASQAVPAYARPLAKPQTQPQAQSRLLQAQPKTLPQPPPLPATGKGSGQAVPNNSLSTAVFVSASSRPHLSLQGTPWSDPQWQSVPSAEVVAANVQVGLKEELSSFRGAIALQPAFTFG